LIYIDEKTQKYRALKRLWSYGNYSRYVRPGYTRVDLQTNTRAQDEMLPTAFIGVNEAGQQELVMVFINEDVLDQTFMLQGQSEYQKIAYYETSDAHDLECVREEAWNPHEPITIPKRTVTTVILTK